MNYKILFIALWLSVSVSAQEKKVWSLREMVDYAAQNNLTVQNSLLNNQLLENAITSARNQKLPSVSGSFDNNLNIAGGDMTRTDGTTTNGTYSYQNSIGVGASMVIYNRGQYRLNEERAQLDLEVALEDVKKTVNDISLQIVNQYLTVMLNKELVLAAEEQLKISEEQLARNQKLYAAGSIPLSQIYESESQVAQNKQQKGNAEINVDQALFNLAQSLQLQDYKLFDVESIALPDDLSNPLYDISEIITYAYQNQPQVKSAEINVKSAEKDIAIAKTNFWPTVSATYNLGTSYQAYFNKGLATDAVLEQWWDNHSHTIGLGVQIPIFNKNLTVLDVNNAEIRKEIAEKQIDIQKQSLKEDIQTAAFLVESNYKQYEANQEAVRAAQLSFDFAEKSLSAGRINLFDYNQAANNLFQAQSTMLQSKYNYIFRMKVLDFYAGRPLLFE